MDSKGCAHELKETQEDLMLLLEIYSPEHVQNFSIGIYPDQDVGNCNILEFRMLGVGKVNFWFPDGLHKIRVVEIKCFGYLRVFQSFILPLLS